MRYLLFSCLLAAATRGCRPSPPSVATRRAALQRAALAAISARPLVASAAQRGAENPYETQMFDQSATCSERTLLGACKAAARPATRASGPSAPPSLLRAVEEPESDLVKRLKERTIQNEEANSRLVREKTLASGMSGTYGPFASKVPVMRVDGTFDSISFSRYDKLKDRKKIVRTATGLDAYVAGFDPDAAEPKREKVFGLF